MRPQQSGRVVRQRKLAKSTLQQVLREDQIESVDYDSLQGQYTVETGVEKTEEKVRHHVINSCGSSRDPPLLNTWLTIFRNTISKPH